MSGTLKALATVLITAGVDQVAGSSGGLDLLAGRGAEAVGAYRELLADLAAGEDLDRVGALGQALLAQGLRRHLGPRVEALLKVGEVDRLRGRAEVLEGHRLLHVRPAQLAHPHVDRVLAALVARLALGAGPLPVALVPAARGLAQAGALAAADPLARPARAGLRLQVVEADLLGAWLLSHRRPPPGGRRRGSARAAAASPRARHGRRCGRGRAL